MKKIVLIAIAAAALYACENPLEYRPEDTGAQLVMTTMMDAGSTAHSVLVTVSNTEYIRSVGTAEARLYVNGALASSTNTLLPSGDNISHSVKRLDLNAAFKAGDEVRLEVDADGIYSGKFTQIVPEPPVVSKADTVRVVRMDGDDRTEYLRFDTSVRDSDKADNYYRVFVMARCDAVFYSSPGVEIGTGSTERLCNMNTENDFILNEGHVGNDESLFEIGTSNVYGIFSDAQFAGKEGTVRPMVDVDSFDNYAEFDGSATSVKIDSKAVLKVQSLPQRYYFYLKAMNLLMSGGDDLALEDVQIPDNVQGGIGFVGISNSVSFDFNLKSVVYDLSY